MRTTYFCFFVGMKTAVNFINTYNNDPAVSVFTCECWQDIAALKPDQHFIFLTDGKTPLFVAAKNVDVRIVKQTGARWFDHWRLHQSLRRAGVNYVIDILPTGFSIEDVLHNKKTSTAQSKDRLVLFEPNGIDYARKGRVSPAVTFVKPAWRTAVAEPSWAAAESIKTTYTGGRSFFLFAGNIATQHQLIELLKAFSIFKKWQQSNMLLVFAGYRTGWTDTLEEKLTQYKFRADVVLINDPPTATVEKLVAASYAMVLPIATNVFCPFLSLAVQSGKAIIISDQPVNRAIIETAAWIDKNNTAEGFAKAMILLYKDEKHLQWLIQQSKQAASELNRQQMLATVWDTIGN